MSLERKNRVAKKRIIGVSITPEAGLELTQIDYATKSIVSYGRRSLDYNSLRREIGDLDVFKDTFSELLMEMSIPHGSEIVLTLPTVVCKINDYPASMDSIQIENAIGDDLYENPYLKNYEPCYSYSILPSSTLQFNRVAFTAAQKSTLVEIAMFIKDLGYKLIAVDTSLSSVLNSLIYLDKINTTAETKWTMMIVEDSCLRIVSMLGSDFIDISEEPISVGEYSSDAENYATVISTAEPILQRTPSQYLCIVSKTNAISAEILSSKITYSAPVIYQEANGYLKEPLMNISPDLDVEYTKNITLDAIGAAIYTNTPSARPQLFNLYNSTLGEVYLSEQPPVILGVSITNAVLATMFTIVFLIIATIVGGFFVWGMKIKADNNAQLEIINKKIADCEKYIAAHPDVTADMFDEAYEVGMGLGSNKKVYSYYEIVGTQIPQKLWLTSLKLGNKTTIEGQADNLESIYAFFKNIKEYNLDSDIKLQKLGLATSNINKILTQLDDDNAGKVNKETLLTTLNAEFYEFRISNDADTGNAKQSNGNSNDLPEDLELIN